MPTIPSAVIHRTSACEELGATYGWDRCLMDASIINRSKRFSCRFIEPSLAHMRIEQEMDKAVSPDPRNCRAAFIAQPMHVVASSNHHHIWVAATV